MTPQFDEIWTQALKVLKTGVVMRAKDLRIPLAKRFQLTDIGNAFSVFLTIERFHFCTEHYPCL